MKRLLLLLLISVMTLATVSAQSNVSTTYYTPRQQAVSRAISVDDITFTDQKTTVSLQYVGNTSGISLLPSTMLVIHMKGGRMMTLKMQRAKGIPVGDDRRISGDALSFSVDFAPLPVGRRAKVKSFDFMEVSGAGAMSSRYFNVYNIRLDKKNSF